MTDIFDEEEKFYYDEVDPDWETTFEEEDYYYEDLDENEAYYQDYDPGAWDGNLNWYALTKEEERLDEWLREMAEDRFSY